MSNPTYPATITTPFLGLSLTGMNQLTALDFLAVDIWASGVGAAAFNFNVPITASPNIPSPLYTGQNETPDLFTPSMYTQDINGAWHVQGGIDTQTVSAVNGPPAPAGTLTWTRRQFYRDTLHSTQVSKNAFLSINHQSCVGTVATNQDRALGIGMSNFTGKIGSFAISNNVVTLVLDNGGLVSGSTGTDRFQVGQVVIPAGLSVGTYLNGVQFTITVAGLPNGSFQTVSMSATGFTHADVSTTTDSGTLDQFMYSMAGIQIETDVYGTPTTVSAPDSEYTAGSFQMSDNHIGNPSAPGSQCTAIRAQYFKGAGAGFWASGAPAAIRCVFTNNSNVNSNGSTVYGIYTSMLDFGPSNNTSAVGIYITQGTPFSNGNYGLRVNGYTSGEAIYIETGHTHLGAGLYIGTKIDTYNSIATVANGVPSEYAQINLTGKVANIGSTTLYAVPSTGAGFYRVTFYLVETTAATVSSTLPSLVLGWTDETGTVQSATFSASSPTANLIGTFVAGEQIVYSEASQNITYQTTSYVSSGATAMAYSLRARVEYLG